jgi:hypothetical protein
VGEVPVSDYGWTEEMRAKRMARDAARIRDVENWWTPHSLPMKTQPWETERRGHMSFGTIRPDQLTIVARNGNGDTLERFESIEELVKVWSVD